MGLQPDNTILAVMDIGSNSVRMVVYDLSVLPPRHLFNEKVFCALGRDLGTTGKLSPDGMSLAMEAIGTYQAAALRHHADDVIVVATAALRDASDGADFAARVRDAYGLDVRILDGDQEARYAAEGVLEMDMTARGVVGDFGGGSLELARVGNEKVYETLSLPMGAFRVRSLGEMAETRLASVLEGSLSIFGSAPALYGIGGMWRALGQAYMDAQGIKADLRGFIVGTAEMIAFCRRIEACPHDDITGTFGFEGHKVDLAPITAMALRVVLEVLAPDRFIISKAGVRDGIVHEYLSSRSKTA